jgi:hypothetical protein
MLVLSWGLGLQSTALLEMSLSGDYDTPKLDLAIFADTGFEHNYSHDIYNFYAPRAIEAGIKVIKIGDQSILDDSYRKVSMPMFVTGNGRRGRMIRRKCTREYKIRPIQRAIRQELGVNPRGRLAANLVELWLGITTDEIERAKDSRVAYINHSFPLLDLNFKRGQCANYLKSKNLPVPGKSSCVFCPYKKSSEWAELKRDQPQTYELIADLEAKINQKELVKIGGQAKDVYFLPSGVALPQADFDTPEADLSEMCDGGFCFS